MTKTAQSPNLIVEKGPEHIEIVGPIKIVLIEPKSKIFWAGVFTSWTILSHVLIGAITTLLVINAVKKNSFPSANELHVILCVVGYQLLMAEAILLSNKYNGINEILTDKKRNMLHLILQIIASLLALCGTVIIVVFRDTNFSSLSFHELLGIVTGGLTIISLTNGFCALFASEMGLSKIGKIFHAVFGISAYLLSSITLILGLISTIQIIQPASYILLLFIVIYSLGVITLPFVRIFQCYK